MSRQITSVSAMAGKTPERTIGQVTKQDDREVVRVAIGFTDGTFALLRGLEDEMTSVEPGPPDWHDQVALGPWSSPALDQRGTEYPEAWEGRVPRRIRLSDSAQPTSMSHALLFKTLRDQGVCDAWVDRDASVAAIPLIGTWARLGRGDFEVVAWWPGNGVQVTPYLPDGPDADRRLARAVEADFAATPAERALARHVLQLVEERDRLTVDVVKAAASACGPMPEGTTVRDALQSALSAMILAEARLDRVVARFCGPHEAPSGGWLVSGREGTIDDFQVARAEARAEAGVGDDGPWGARLLLALRLGAAVESLVWLKRDGAGFTSDLAAAGRFSAEEARERESPGEVLAVPEAAALLLAARPVRAANTPAAVEWLRRASARAAGGGE